MASGVDEVSDAETPKPLLSFSEMQVVEHLLNMRTGYVLDFSDRSSDEFVANEVGVDATAPRFSVDGGSKARRLRRVIPTLSAGKQAKLLRAFMTYRDSPAREGRFDRLDDEWHRGYEEVVRSLERRVEQAAN